jgi:hypothetical protein
MFHVEHRKAEAPWAAPTSKCSSAKKVRILTFIAEEHLTRGARRCNWTTLKGKAPKLALLLNNYFTLEPFGNV